jgi:hypothetical protein
MSKNCKFLKKDGTPCRADVQIGKDSCVFHDPLKAEKVRRGRRQGGIKRSRQVACLASRTPDLPLTTSAEISSFLADTTNQVRRLQLDRGVGNTIGYLASVQLASLRQGKVEDHLSKLENCLGLIPRTAISDHLTVKEPNPGSVPRRVERLQREVEFQVFIRGERIIENMTDDELEHLAATGEWPNRLDPLPGTSRLDRMSRKELIELWKEDRDRFVGRNQEQLAFYIRHGHWPEQNCGPDCKTVEEGDSSDLPVD